MTWDSLANQQNNKTGQQTGLPMCLIVRPNHTLHAACRDLCLVRNETIMQQTNL
jgi:hypothetical protein